MRRMKLRHTGARRRHRRRYLIGVVIVVCFLVVLMVTMSSAPNVQSSHSEQTDRFTIRKPTFVLGKQSETPTTPFSSTAISTTATPSLTPAPLFPSPSVPVTEEMDELATATATTTSTSPSPSTSSTVAAAIHQVTTQRHQQHSYLPGVVFASTGVVLVDLGDGKQAGPKLSVVNETTEGGRMQNAQEKLDENAVENSRNKSVKEENNEGAWVGKVWSVLRFRVELLRQRLDRRTWAMTPAMPPAPTTTTNTTTAAAAAAHNRAAVISGSASGKERRLSHVDSSEKAAIIGITPEESDMLFFPDEVLVEQYADGDDAPNPKPDPLRRMAAIIVDKSTEGDGRDGVSITTAKAEYERRDADAVQSPTIVKVPDTRADDGDDATAAEPSGAIALAESSAPLLSSSSSSLQLLTVSSKGSLVWRPGAQEEARTRADEHIIVIRLSKRCRNSACSTGQASGEDRTFTDALRALLTMRNVTRLYGLTTDQSTSSSDPESRTSLIPLDNYTRTIMVYGSARRGRAQGNAMTGGAPGVVPLLYVQLGKDHSSDVSKERTVGILWLTSSPFLIHVRTSVKTPEGTEEEYPDEVRLRDAIAAAASSGYAETEVSFTSTAGATRVYLLPGPTAHDVLRQYYTITGFPVIPPLFALGYHHGFRRCLPSDSARPFEKAPAAKEGEEDVQGALKDTTKHTATTAQDQLRALSTAFYKRQVPLDAVLATCHETQSRTLPFSFNTTSIPDPIQLHIDLWERGGRYLLLQATPNIPARSHSPLFVEARRQQFFVRTDPDEDTWFTFFSHGGTSHLVDFVSPRARRWFRGLLKYRRFVGSTNHTFMSIVGAAPFVPFSDTAFTLPMTSGHSGGLTHREVHNVYGLYMAMSVQAGHLRRTRYLRRGLTVTDSYFAGLQRFAAVSLRSGASAHDPLGVLQEEKEEREQRQQQQHQQEVTYMTGSAHLVAAWGELKEMAERYLALNLLGLPVAGANFGDVVTLRQSPTAAGTEMAQDWDTLIVRWYQLGMLMPLMQADLPSTLPVFSSTLPFSLEESLGWPVGKDYVADLEHTVHTRYALLPYLYTVLHGVSDKGDGFWWRDNAVPEKDGLCFHVGPALRACPVLRSNVDPTSYIVQHRSRRYRDFWSGALNADAKKDGTTTDGDATAASTPPAWMRGTSDGTDTAMPSLQIGHKLRVGAAPLYQQEGTIVPTFNSVGVMHSTHSPANLTLTVTLPSLQKYLKAPPVAAGSTSTVLLARGELYWDEGSLNFQSAPRRRPIYHRTGVAEVLPPLRDPQYCSVSFKCELVITTATTTVGDQGNAGDEDQNVATPTNAVPHLVQSAKLLLSGTQVSNTCSAALEAMESLWQVPAFGAKMRASLHVKKAQAAARAQDEADDADRNDLEQQSTRRPSAATATTEPVEDTEDAGKDVAAAGLLLSRTFLVERVRFLVALPGDADLLASVTGGASTNVVGKLRVSQGVETETDAQDAGGTARTRETSAILVRASDEQLVVSLAGEGAPHVFGVSQRNDERNVEEHAGAGWQRDENATGVNTVPNVISTNTWSISFPIL